MTDSTSPSNEGHKSGQIPVPGADAAPAPSHVEVVEQLLESTDHENGPNETLRRHIEKYSRYRPVFTSLASMLLGAVFAPALLAFLIAQLSPAYDLSALDGAVQRGLSSVVLPLLVSLVLTRAMSKNGLAVRYLNWSPALAEALKYSLDSILYTVLPMRFMYISLETFDGGRWNDSLGRLAFVLSMTGLMVGLYLTSRKIRAWLNEVQPEGMWYTFLRDLLLWCLPLMPLTMAVMATIGYYFTAEELSSRTVWTVLLMIGISLLGGLISCLLLIAQFRIKLRELSHGDDGGISSDDSIDISAISGQVNRLIRATALVVMVIVGWEVWSDVLPIIDYLDEFHLMQTVVASPDSTDGVTQWITLRHLLMAVGLAAITYVLSTNLPGLLEITVLDRLPLDRGGRYAITFVARYLVAVVGILITCQMVGFSWGRVQWLAAGLTVGLGFGLQEIFANLVSGLIILIERPIRVGDTVTVSDTTGTVVKMALRATTVMDYDYRELIVPNKKFITENVMNWSLTDNRSRLVLKVGVAYGSDTALVQTTLVKIANRHPFVLRSPEPQVLFAGFGNSTLDFELRVVIPTRDVFVQVTHELHMAIDEAFRQKNIQIAFPQQDIYIKNLKDLPFSGPSGVGTPEGSAAAVSGVNSGASQPTVGSRASSDRDAVAESPSQPEAAEDSPEESGRSTAPGAKRRRVVRFPLQELRDRKPFGNKNSDRDEDKQAG